MMRIEPFFLLACLITTLPDAARANEVVVVRAAAFNVAAGKKGTAENIADIFRNFQADIIGFSEVPGPEWIARVASELDMAHAYTGELSSANHDNKYKSVLSKTPLSNTREYRLDANGMWGPASAVRAETVIAGVAVTVYVTHVAASRKNDGQIKQLLDNVLAADSSENILLMGDFNTGLNSPQINQLESAGFRAIWRDLAIDIDKQTSVVSLDKRKRYGVIDHIFYRQAAGVKALKGGLVNITAHQPLSDHKPVWGLISYPQRAPEGI